MPLPLHQLNQSNRAAGQSQIRPGPPAASGWLHFPPEQPPETALRCKTAPRCTGGCQAGATYAGAGSVAAGTTVSAVAAWRLGPRGATTAAWAFARRDAGTGLAESGLAGGQRTTAGGGEAAFPRLAALQFADESAIL